MEAGSSLQETVMHVKPLEQSTEKYLQRSLMAYLEGEQNLRWIASIIGSGYDARNRLAKLQGYGDLNRHRELSKWLDSHRLNGER